MGATGIPVTQVNGLPHRAGIQNKKVVNLLIRVNTGRIGAVLGGRSKVLKISQKFRAWVETLARF